MKRLLCFAVVFILLFSAFASENVQESASTTVSETGTLTVKTNVSNAEIYVNGDYIGRSPQTVELLPGVYTVRVAKLGYYTKDCIVTITAARDSVLYLELDQLTGYIDFLISEEDASCYVDGLRVNGKSTEVTEGTHSIEVKLFGYETYRETITVVANLHTIVATILKPADFTVSEVVASPESFNPDNPGNLGLTRITFDVSAPGSGCITITNSNGTVVANHQFEPFTTWEQEWSWDGLVEGKVVSDDVYTINLQVTAESQVDADKKTITFEPINRQSTVRVDSSLSYPLLGIGTNGLGVGLVSSSRLFPKGSIATGLTAEPLVEIPSGSIHAVPVYCSIVGTPLSWLELTARAGIWFREISPTPLGFGAGIKVGHSFKNFSYAGFIQYEYVTQNLLGITTEAGLRTGFSGGWQWGLFHLDLNTSFIIGPEQGKFTPFDSKLENSLSLLFQNGNFSIGGWGMLDCAVRKPDATKTFIWNYIAGGGLDYSILIPSTNMLLTAKVYCLKDIPSQKSYLFSSLGMTIIY